MKKLTLTIIAFFICVALHAFPCTKYVFDFGSKAMPGKLRISWSINTGFNRCGFPVEEIFKNRFVVSVENFFGEVLAGDTTDQHHFVVDAKINGDKPVTFRIQEFGTSDHSTYWFTIRPEHETMPQLLSKTDSLNFYLLNGYFFNAMAMAAQHEKYDFINEIKKEYKVLFPENYPAEQTYFNSYVDPASLRLVKMPVVEGLATFIDTINDLTKKEPKRSAGFKVFAKISNDGKVSEYEVVPPSDKQMFEKALPQLKFSNHLEQVNHLVIIVGRSKNEKKFRIVNERALMDHRSPAFRRQYPFKAGAIH